jgi:hypothetical protein
MSRPERVVSGGQTGADRAALDVAIALAIPHGGWCPKGRKAEDGPIDGHYALRETGSAAYHVRTERNVRDADGTVVITQGAPTGGSLLTIDLAQRHGTPLLHIDLDEQAEAEAAADLELWRQVRGVAVVNVAGPRESTTPGIGARVASLLTLAWADA